MMEDESRIAECSKQALSLMAQYKVLPHPKRYLVWYEYCLGQNPGLVADVKQLLSAGQRLTPQAHEFLYEKHITPQTNDFSGSRAVEETQAILKNLVAKLMEATNFSEQECVKLDACSLELHAATDITQVKGLVERVVEHAGKMLTSNRDLRHRVEEEANRARELNQVLEQVKREALTDTLTGLANRKALNTRLEELIARHQSDGTVFSLLMLDLDHFKQVNDTYGHIIGDAILRFVGKVVTQFIRGNDFAARFGGEEFCVLLPDTAFDQSIAVAQNIRHALENNRLKIVQSNKLLPPVTVSIGATAFRQDDNAASVFERADKALYQAKNAGRNQVKSLR